MRDILELRSKNNFIIMLTGLDTRVRVAKRPRKRVVIQSCQPADVSVDVHV